MSRETFSDNSLINDALEQRINPIIWLDIGGKLFKTRVDTLLKGGQKCRFIQDLYPWTYHSSSDIELYYDRDGEQFHYILNYLRNKKLICPNEPYILNQLLCEASFYNLAELKDELWVRLHYTPYGKPISEPTSRHISFTENITENKLPQKEENFIKNLEHMENDNNFDSFTKHSQGVSTTCEEASTMSSSSQQSNHYFDRFSLMNDDPLPPITLDNVPNLGPKEFNFITDF